MFPSDCIDDCAFQRSAAGPVRRLTDLVSPSSGMTQPSTLNLLSRGPLFIMSQKASHTSARLGESQKSSCSPPTTPRHPSHKWPCPIYLLCVSLKPDNINQGLNFKGQVPSPSKNTKLLKWRTSHCTYAPILLHLTPHFAGGPHIATSVQDHTVGLIRPTKDLVRPHTRPEYDLMGPQRVHHLKLSRTAKASLLSSYCSPFSAIRSLETVSFFFFFF